MEDVHQNILRKNHCCIVDTLNLSESKVLDILLEDGVISSDEQGEILSKAIKRNQNASLLSVLKSKSPSKKPFETFLKALQPDYDFIVQALRTNENKHEDCECQKDIETKCYYCLLKQNLNPNHLSHILYEKEVISDDDLEDLNKNDISRHDKVCKLLNILREHPDQEFVSKQFRSCLKAKYEHLLTAKDDDGMDFYLTCRCPNNIKAKVRRKGNSRRQTLSSELCWASYSKGRTAGDIIEKEPGQNTFNRTHKKSLTLGLNITDVCDGLKDKIGIRKGRNAPKRNLSPLLQAESYHDERINVTRRKASAVREKSEVHEPRSSKCLSKSYCQTYPSQNLLVRQIPMVLPNNNILMRKSAKLWNILYGMMARGEWDKFNSFFSEGLETFRDNADLKIQLYRSNMSACTFYRNDPAKAQEMFEKAMELVPKTSMPTWHLGRILPLKVEIYVQKMKFNDASSLLEQAHQAVTLLSPCMPTGNIYFFQGLYLSTVLRCTRRDTQSAASIVERVKRCFLTAIQHYEQDSLFAVKPIIGQVYLFLALFSLGVDYKSRYYQTHNACANDIKMAQHYLDLFESCCWEDSTNWSQMLFFIARGEQFQQMKNLKRSIDYFKDARKCSVLGNFNEHRGFIDNTIQLVEEKLKERTLIQCSQLRSSDTILQSLMELSDDSK
ncbi:hypothetical protein ACJMK2_041858 [Sinanodonta woodiana]|uniref:CARD domain-containing protein n=1 Tax=Sinanodonta woodiana TaxID=1069815 RepID=A0ABD3W6W6_SINWO